MNIAQAVADALPAHWQDEGLRVVRSVDTHIGDNTDRRESAVSSLTKGLQVSEQIARLLVELGVWWLRQKEQAPPATE